MLAAQSRPLRGLTVRDLEQFQDDENRYEIVDGVLHVSPLPGYPHQQAATELVRVVANFVRANQLGRVFTSGLKVVLDDGTGIGPDLVYISSERMDQMRDDGYYGTPDLVVEVLSSKPHLDCKIKFDKYARASVPQYWIVDPKQRIVIAYELDDGIYRIGMEARGDMYFEPSLFPGLSIPLIDLWA